ncbi:MAG: hypothetical protein HOO99_12965 [Hyphomicrobiaceae bacterium]|nr:hypothetical protein [Hyphomicrobiaceae bacterium]
MISHSKIALSKTVTSVAVVASLIAGQAVVVASPAAASEAPLYEAPQSSRGYKRYVAPRHYEPQRAYGHRPHGPVRRDRSGDAVGAAILGIGAVIIGAAIADAHRKQRRGHDD